MPDIVQQWEITSIYDYRTLCVYSCTEQIFASISPPPYAISTYRAACRLFNHSTIEPIDKQTVVGNGEQILTIS